MSTILPSTTQTPPAAWSSASRMRRAQSACSGAGGLFLGGGDGVLEVDHHRIGAGGERLGETVWPMAGDEQDAAGEGDVGTGHGAG